VECELQLLFILSFSSLRFAVKHWDYLSSNIHPIPSMVNLTCSEGHLEFGTLELFTASAGGGRQEQSI